MGHTGSADPDLQARILGGGRKNDQARKKLKPGSILGILDSIVENKRTV